VPERDSFSAAEKKLYGRIMEVFAGFLTHTDQRGNNKRVEGERVSGEGEEKGIAFGYRHSPFFFYTRVE
jgi:hypothetical protein